jgi:hypothetical protein
MTKAINKLTVALGVCAFLGIGVSIYLYTFPVAPWYVPGIGTIRLERLWWKGDSELTVDKNGDGVIEERAIFAGPDGPRSPHDPAIETWEDTNRDGRMDLHTVLKGDVVFVEIDTNGDGIFDQKLIGDNARRYLASRDPRRSKERGIAQ